MKILTLEEACAFMKTLLESEYIFACIGTYIRSDDAAALELCNKLIHRYSKSIILCEYGLENCIGSIVESNAKKILIIDSILTSNIPEGSIVLFSDSEIDETYTLSTHSIPITTSISILRNILETDLHILFLGIVIKNIDIGFDTSPKVKNVIENITKCIMDSKI